jgi:hypothetical protein
VRRKKASVFDSVYCYFNYIVSWPFLIHDVINKARAFVTLSRFHPNLTFTSKGEENPIGAVKVGSFLCPQILD